MLTRAFLALNLLLPPAIAADLPNHVWLEAETFSPLQGSNFAFQSPDKHQKGAWGIAGPGVADAWSQGGDSEWMAIAARADEPNPVIAKRKITIPVTSEYFIWVRYADYREKRETFGIRITQGNHTWEHRFGEEPVVDSLDPLSLLWDWSYGWGQARADLTGGPAEIELFTTGPVEARRQVDCICLTTDPLYHPSGREKPQFAAWRYLHSQNTLPDRKTSPLIRSTDFEIPAAWRVNEEPPKFLWNVGGQWEAELKKNPSDRQDQPFGVDEPLLNDFLAAHRNKSPALYGDSLSGPVWHVPVYPTAFATNSPFMAWLDQHADRPFAILLNYANPNWPKDSDRDEVHANLKKYGSRFIGYVSGESLSHTDYDHARLRELVSAAKNRNAILSALREIHTAAVIHKFSDYYGKPITAEAAWSDVIPCLSASAEAFTHAECAWGVQRIGHENTANSPTLARRLAFLRGAARQFQRQFADYQSCNFGDAATMFSRQAFFFPASSRYVLDNSYDAFAGAGTNWLWKDYLLWHLAGVSAFYNEQGVDMFWKPGGNAAGDDRPVQLSPKGKVAETALRLAHELPRGTQFTPVAFLLDEAHGWAQERFAPGAFGLDPAWNPDVLSPGLHEAAIRAWFDIAYYPAPETQNEPCTAVRQCYVNGVFGDVFDVICNTHGKTSILGSYPVVIASGEVPLDDEWGQALSSYVENGGTLTVCSGQFSGHGAELLQLPPATEFHTGTAISWKPTQENLDAQSFHFSAIPPDSGEQLATTPDGSIVATRIRRGKGSIIYVSIPFGLAVDERPVPLLAALLRDLLAGILPVRVMGDVEWTLNALPDGRWLVALLNNSGVDKPQHGIVPTRHEEIRHVRVNTSFEIGAVSEWQTRAKLAFTASGTGGAIAISLPAGATRIVVIDPKR